MWMAMGEVVVPGVKWVEWIGWVYGDSEEGRELLDMRRFWDVVGSGLVEGQVDGELLGRYGLYGEEAVVAVRGLVLKGMMERSGLLRGGFEMGGERDG